MKYSRIGWATFCLGAVLLSGCQCYRATAVYSQAVDRFADTKLALDPLYEPGLDVSRIGMPDWLSYGVNDRLCPCQKGCKCPACRGCEPVYYPAEYRMKYWASLEEQQAEQTMDEIDLPEPSQSDDAEMAPEPMPLPEEDLEELSEPTKDESGA